MTRLKTGINQFLPDFWQLVDLRPKHIHALTTGQFGVQAVFLGNLANGNQAIWSHFTTGHSWDHRIRTIFLDIAQIVVIAILQAGMAWFQYKVIPAGGQNIGHSWFTDITAQTVTMLLD